jgi:hypothetical protein
LQQAQLCTKRATTHHMQTAEGTTGTAHESKTSSTQIEETSLEILTHLSCRSMSKAISCQKHPKQHSWRHKPRGPKRTHALSSITSVKISRKQANSQRRRGISQQRHRPRSPHRHNSPRHRRSNR